MEKVKVKICDVRTPEVAAFCAQEGVDFLGLHQIWAPITNEKLGIFQSIKQAAPGLSLVLVTKESNLDKLLEMCLQFEWNCVQMHFQTAQHNIVKFKEKLRANGSSIKIISVIETRSLIAESLQSISKVSDFLLFDSSMRGGTGVLSDRESLAKVSSVVKGIPYFVAGGLTPENVVSVIGLTRPFAVDVQSGVESSDPDLKHHKDPKRIKAFVEAVKSCNL
ncbi:phosphoribosylanthranilate isomerase [Pseudobacteroides cellulosolvens]|uniref:N-(5'-phosphoribosyl)anthranilate isomerase n=1 Tax=Pseudobacteroides cellulosolvens ATCC 35603 = DSM 2933 TaxID=398512 RepID=A0A0L6JXR4_9FIRM|nr:phosphoribosylanthranilate isomerase [Pseudobacteroides cellulosolvens]KNY30554.1 hypothetical protein Bccel_5834 [Pseudobacteroides cellulosolvens ATCC 35603 = DSM 2933]KNY30562.1 hypothetical protein Bccel_5842 [Pseudobacteroides cellulosolvens ATCC 35603 = DSM 2933]